MSGDTVFIPPKLARTVTGEFGERGAAWLARLPEQLREVSEHFRLRVGKPYQDLSYNYVARAETEDGTPVVLKLGVPHRELLTEAETLTLYEGAQALVSLLGGAPDEGVLILERLEPGTPLREVDDEEATEVVASLMRELRRLPTEDSTLPTVADWGRGFARVRALKGSAHEFPAEILDEAESAFFELDESCDERVVLHGDLHHWNVCAAARRPWLAIDPKGVVGDPAYEVGAFLRNPLPEILAASRPERIIRRRVEVFSARLGFPAERLLRWGFAQAVLSACWGFEGRDEGWRDALRLAESFRSV
ncbi:MAG TPA: aminoglycoside phosphotransferase family protein [Pyrinomonadaceae bacterium]|nr:aminoglycoside phosphotransferase family protein [Pyrinomonadaceae bacterium]